MIDSGSVKPNVFAFGARSVAETREKGLAADCVCKWESALTHPMGRRGLPEAFLDLEYLPAPESWLQG